MGFWIFYDLTSAKGNDAASQQNGLKLLPNIDACVIQVPHLGVPPEKLSKVTCVLQPSPQLAADGACV